VEYRYNDWQLFLFAVHVINTVSFLEIAGIYRVKIITDCSKQLACDWMEDILANRSDIDFGYLMCRGSYEQWF